MLATILQDLCGGNGLAGHRNSGGQLHSGARGNESGPDGGAQV